jgi:hypothetical protein
MKPDEAALLLALQESKEQCYVRNLVRDLQIPEKRAAYICDKWSGKGWYDYGVSVLAGWLTEEGKAIRVKDSVRTGE